MDKLKPEVREALRTLGNTCSSDCACVCIETRSPYVPTKCRLVGIIRDELHRLTAELEKAEAERDALRGFAREIMGDEWYLGDLDGGSRQDIAVKYGVLVAHEVTEPCCDNCTCAEYDDFPMTCYRLNRSIVPEQEGSS